MAPIGCLCFSIPQCAQHFLAVASLRNGTSPLLVLLYSSVCAACSGYCESEERRQSVACASLFCTVRNIFWLMRVWEMAPTGCLCSSILQFAQQFVVVANLTNGTNRFLCAQHVLVVATLRNGTNRLLVLLYSAMCAAISVTNRLLVLL